MISPRPIPCPIDPDERKKYVTEIDIAENDITESTMAGFDYASYNANLH